MLTLKIAVYIVVGLFILSLIHISEPTRNPGRKDFE